MLCPPCVLEPRFVTHNRAALSDLHSLDSNCDCGDGLRWKEMSVAVGHVLAQLWQNNAIFLLHSLVIQRSFNAGRNVDMCHHLVLTTNCELCRMGPPLPHKMHRLGGGSRTPHHTGTRLRPQRVATPARAWHAPGIHHTSTATYMFPVGPCWARPITLGMGSPMDLANGE